jgi:hypothetical protein
MLHRSQRRSGLMLEAWNEYFHLESLEDSDKEAKSAFVAPFLANCIAKCKELPGEIAEEDDENAIKQKNIEFIKQQVMKFDCCTKEHFVFCTENGMQLEESCKRCQICGEERYSRCDYFFCGNRKGSRKTRSDRKMRKSTMKSSFRKCMHEKIPRRRCFYTPLLVSIMVNIEKHGPLYIESINDDYFYDEYEKPIEERLIIHNTVDAMQERFDHKFEANEKEAIFPINLVISMEYDGNELWLQNFKAENVCAGTPYPQMQFRYNPFSINKCHIQYKYSEVEKVLIEQCLLGELYLLKEGVKVELHNKIYFIQVRFILDWIEPNVLGNPRYKWYY